MLFLSRNQSTLRDEESNATMGVDLFAGIFAIFVVLLVLILLKFERSIVVPVVAVPVVATELVINVRAVGDIHDCRISELYISLYRANSWQSLKVRIQESYLARQVLFVARPSGDQVFIIARFEDTSDIVFKSESGTKNLIVEPLFDPTDCVANQVYIWGTFGDELFGRQFSPAPIEEQYGVFGYEIRG